MDQSSSSSAAAERRLDQVSTGLDALLRAGADLRLALDALRRAAP